MLITLLTASKQVVRQVGKQREAMPKKKPTGPVYVAALNSTLHPSPHTNAAKLKAKQTAAATTTNHPPTPAVIDPTLLALVTVNDGDDSNSSTELAETEAETKTEKKKYHYDYRHKYSQPGKPTKLTQSLQAAFCELLSEGNYVGDSCRAVGIVQRTYEHWMIRGELAAPGDEMYVEFRAAVEQAQANSVISSVRAIRKAGDFQWQAHAWLLERKRPDDWGRKDRKEVTTTADNKLTIKLVYADKDDTGRSANNPLIVDGNVRELPEPAALTNSSDSNTDDSQFYVVIDSVLTEAAAFTNDSDSDSDDDNDSNSDES